MGVVFKELKYCPVEKRFPENRTNVQNLQGDKGEFKEELYYQSGLLSEGLCWPILKFLNMSWMKTSDQIPNGESDQVGGKDPSLTELFPRK